MENSFFCSQNAAVLEWPSRQSELIIIEKCWGSVARAVYANIEDSFYQYLNFKLVLKTKDKIKIQ